MKKRHAKSLALYLMILVAIVIFVSTFARPPVAQSAPINYGQLVQNIKDGQVKKLRIERNIRVSNAGVARVTLKDAPEGQEQSVDIVNIDGLDEIARAAKDKYPDMEYEVAFAADSGWVVEILFPLLMFVGVVVVMFFLIGQMQGGGGRLANFGKSRAKAQSDDKNRRTFEDVAGLKEEKTELAEIVEFLREPKKFMDIGARIPKGVLLVGPPGTGKTLLAKAVSGEAGVPFFSISGSDFVEMFVGVGASRVRDLFEQAKKNSPCIIFIDEIDAVGRRRGAGLGGGHDEREQTLNQLLVEMDGFGVNEGVIIIAATNRPDILDPALLRPGRFDRRVVVGAPDAKGRESILRVHAKGKKFADDVDFGIIAHTTSGFTGADLENLLNEAALLAARDDKKVIDMSDVRRAFIKVGVGTEKKSRVVSPRERKMTAYHETGHAILFELLSELDPVHIISIIPTGIAGGYTMPLPSDDRAFLSKKYMTQDIIALLGGRTAEELVIGDITTGASNDIERATAIARSMVVKYGMSEKLGPLQFGNESEEVFIGRDFGHVRNYGEDVATAIDQEIRGIVESAHTEARRILCDNMDVLHATAHVLMEREKITGEEFRAILKKETPGRYTEVDETEYPSLPEAISEEVKPGETDEP
ncbi:MAG: ATP-dependent zinc metalloprotease FtsH [Clostridiales bacterium]|nr:ATP-dependent zinc metalloprotease FtsH [Clostridiales bacterium]